MNLTTLKKAPKVIAVSACLLASGHSFAQGFDFGLRGNIQSSTLLNLKDNAAGPELDYVNKVRFVGGVGADYFFNHHMGVGLDVIYSRQGQDYKGIVADIPINNTGVFCNTIQQLASINKIPFTGDYTATVALTYIKIPILFKFTGNSTKRVFFSSFIGPQIGLLNSVKYSVNGTDASVSSIGMNTKDAYKKTDLDGVLGLGAGVNISKNFMASVHLHLEFGLGDAENKGATETVNGQASDFYNAKRGTTNNATGGFLISLNYKLHKKEKESGSTKTTKTTEKTKTKK